MTKSLFITGTGTDVGKTYAAGLLLRKLSEAGMNAGYFKAAMSGNSRDSEGNLLPGDAVWVKRVSPVSQPLESMCPYVYETAVSPHLAAKIEGNPVDLENVLRHFDALCDQYDWVVAEGSGGILCPLRWDDRKIGLADFVRSRRLCSLVVADAGLGTINAAVLTIEYMRTHRLPVKGILLNRFEPGNKLHEDNLLMCERMTGIRVVGTICPDDTELGIPIERVKALFEEIGETE